MGKIFGLFLLGLVLMQSAWAECVSNSNITKCARLPESLYWSGYNSETDQHIDFVEPQYSDDGTTWSVLYNGKLFVSGVARWQAFDTVCQITYPFVTDEQSCYSASLFTSNAGQACTDVVSACEMSFKFGDITAIPGDVCPAGFYTVPYDAGCGVGMVDVSGVPNCDDDASGDYCVIKSETPCELGISRLMVSTGLSFQLYAEKYTEPALHIGYNGGICYAKLEQGKGNLNIQYNNIIYHVVGDASASNPEPDLPDPELPDPELPDPDLPDPDPDLPDPELPDPDPDLDEPVFWYVPDLRVDSRYDEFQICAAGTFTVDWGDGTVETITKNDANCVRYYHDHPGRQNIYTVKITGQATAYSDFFDGYNAAISFPGYDGFHGRLVSVGGCLGCVFPTLADGTQPRFAEAFNGCNLSDISEISFTEFDKNGNFVRGISGPATDNMFYFTFANNQITSIPENLFGGIRGEPAESMFSRTFEGNNITSIPENLFGGIRGAPAPYMFYGTFWINNITSIPENLFGGIRGAPAEYMFFGTFEGNNITSIPENLFGGIRGAPAEAMFWGTFADNRVLTSIPENLFGGIYGAPAGSMFNGTFYNNWALTSIPENLFGGIYGAPAEAMFANTFSNNRALTRIPENLFGDINGPAAKSMFRDMFYGCSALTGPSAKIGGKYLYEIWPNATYDQVWYMYTGATGLDDYANIPDAWK